MMRDYRLTVAILACVLLPMSMFGAGAHRDGIINQIDTMAESSGLTRVSHRLYRDWLNEGAHQQVSFHLDPNVRYYLLGACDVDCANLEFNLLDPAGNSVSRDVDHSGRPVVTVEPESRGRYQLRATMRSCNIQPCEWGVRAYRR